MFFGQLSCTIVASLLPLLLAFLCMVVSDGICNAPGDHSTNNGPNRGSNNCSATWFNKSPSYSSCSRSRVIAKKISLIQGVVAYECVEVYSSIFFQGITVWPSLQIWVIKPVKIIN